MEDQEEHSHPTSEKPSFIESSFLLSLAIVLCFGISLAIYAFPGPMFVYSSVIALPFAIGVFIATLVSPRYWMLWPILIHVPISVRILLKMFPRHDASSFMFQLLMKEFYLSIPAVLIAMLVALGILRLIVYESKRT